MNNINIEECGFIKWINNYSPKTVAFVTSVITGFIAYGYSMSNDLINGDGLGYGYRYSAGSWDVSQGRWALPLLDGRFLSSWFEGILCILLLSLASLYVVKVFSIQKMAVVIATSAILVTQTHFVQWQGSPYILVPYSLAYFCSILASYLIVKSIFDTKKTNWWKGLLAACIIAFYLGIYQSYLAVTIMLTYIVLIIDFMKNSDIKNLFHKAAQLVLIILLASVLYVICLKLQMYRYNVVANDARGWGAFLAGDIPFFRNPFGTIRNAYMIFLRLLFVDGLINFSVCHKAVYIIMIVLVGFVAIHSLIISKQKAQNLCAILMISLIPAVIMMLVFITDVVIPWSMYPAISFVPIIFLGGYEFFAKDSKVFRAGQIVIYSCMLFLLIEQIYIGQVDYLNLKLRNEKMYAQSIRILDRIETSEYYEEGMPIILVGALQYKYPNTLEDFNYNLQGYEAYVMDWLPYTGMSYEYIVYISRFMGVQLNIAADYNQMYQEVSECEWFKDMDSFPATNCTYEYNGILVVKLSDI